MALGAENYIRSLGPIKHRLVQCIHFIWATSGASTSILVYPPRAQKCAIASHIPQFFSKSTIDAERRATAKRKNSLSPQVRRDQFRFHTIARPAVCVHSTDVLGAGFLGFVAICQVMQN